MLSLRKAQDRGKVDFGWLDSRHSFSFGEYYDPNFVGFGPLRVINDDRIAGGGAFPMHPHRDMEIVTYMVAGSLQHRDSLGRGSTIFAGDVQRMTAGAGIRHSESNASESEAARLLQIWIAPNRRGLAPSYEQKSFPQSEKRDRLRLIASPDGRDGSLVLHCDVRVYATVLSPDARVEHPIAEGRIGWAQAVQGAVRLNGQKLEEGDGAAVTTSGPLELKGEGPAAGEILLFDMAKQAAFAPEP